MVCATAGQCARTPYHLTYDNDDGSERLCITRDACPSKGYELRIQCLTYLQCARRSSIYTPNNDLHTCVSKSWCKEGSYDRDGKCLSRLQCEMTNDGVIEGASA